MLWRWRSDRGSLGEAVATIEPVDDCFTAVNLGVHMPRVSRVQSLTTGCFQAPHPQRLVCGDEPSRGRSCPPAGSGHRSAPAVDVRPQPGLADTVRVEVGGVDDVAAAVHVAVEDLPVRVLVAAPSPIGDESTGFCYRQRAGRVDPQMSTRRPSQCADSRWVQPSKSAVFRSFASRVHSLAPGVSATDASRWTSM